MTDELEDVADDLEDGEQSITLRDALLAAYSNDTDAANQAAARARGMLTRLTGGNTKAMSGLLAANRVAFPTPSPGSKLADDLRRHEASATKLYAELAEAKRRRREAKERFRETSQQLTEQMVESLEQLAESQARLLEMQQAQELEQAAARKREIWVLRITAMGLLVAVIGVAVAIVAIMLTT